MSGLNMCKFSFTDIIPFSQYVKNDGYLFEMIQFKWNIVTNYDDNFFYQVLRF